MVSSAKFSTYKNLIVYQKSKLLAVDTIKYLSGSKYPKIHEFLIIQMLKTITSVGANIAEGYGRHYRKSYRQFLSISRGSCFEFDYWLEVAIKLKKFNNDILEDFKKRNNEIIKMLTVMMKNLEIKPQS